MADKRISQLPSGAFTPNSIIPIVANGVTSQTTYGDILTQINNRAIFITGGTFDSIGGITTLTLNNGNSFNVTGYFTGYTYTLQDTVDKQNSMMYDGSGLKYPTVDAVNELANNLALASINTGFIDTYDDFIMTRIDDNTLGITASDKGIIFKSLLETYPFAPASAILQIPETTINLNAIPLSGLGITGDGIYIRFIGFNDNGEFTYSNASFSSSLSTCQLGLLILKVSGGTISFEDATRNVKTMPSIASYSNLELLMLGLQSDVIVRPNDGTMTISNTSGSIKGISVNWHGTNNDEKLIPSHTVTSFTHLSQANALSPIPPVFMTAVTTDQYWNGSTLVTLSTASAATIQRWIVTINGTLALQYGEREYASLETARDNVSTASFLDILPSETYVEISRLVAIRDTTDLSNNQQAIFVTTAGGGNGASSSSVWGTINGNITNQTDLFTTFLPIVNRNFVNLGTATTGTTNINLSDGINFKLFVTGDTSINVIPYNDGTEVNLIIKSPIAINPTIQYSPNTKLNNNSISQIVNIDFPRDTNFNIDGIGGFNQQATSFAQQTDGKLIVGGNFTLYNGISTNRIARLNTNGSLDNSFAIGVAFNNSVYTVAIQPDGKILVGGTFTTYQTISKNNIVRLNTDGSIDSGFNMGTGFVTGGAGIYEILQQSGDSKLIVCGYFTSYNGTPVNGIVRLNTDGTLDNTFNSGNTGFNPAGAVLSANFQGDGKILCGGSFTSYNGVSLINFCRLNPDGTFDNTLSASFNDVNFSDIIPQSDGKIIVGGSFVRYNPISVNKLIKLNSDGSNDNTFNIGTGFNNSVNAETVQSDGKVLVVGDFTQYSATNSNRIIRLNTNATPDNTFNIGTGFNNSVTNVLMQSDNKFLIAGSFTQYSGSNISQLARLNNNASIDGTFSNLYLNNSVKTFIIQTGDSKIIIGGDFTAFNNPTQNSISKINLDGGFDVIFSAGSGFNIGINTIIETSGDSKLIIGGDFTTYQGISVNRLIRLNYDGNRDISFSGGTGFNATINAIIQQPDGKILVSGNFTQYSGITTGVTRLVRLNLDGSKDSSLLIGTGFNATVSAMTQQLNGKILVGGDFTQFSGITTGVTRFTRLNLDGSKDATLNIGTGFSASVNKIVVQTGDSKILVGGSFTQYSGVVQNYITRLNTDGSRDITFSSTTGFDNIVKTIKLQPDNKILVGGTFTRYSTVPANRMIKLNNNGSVDSTFSGNTGGVTAPVLCIIQQSGDSKIIISGQFVTQGALMRLNTDGNKDTTFSGVTTGFNSFVYRFHIQSDDKVVALGAFTTFNGIATRPYHIRLNTDGSKDNTYYSGTGFSNYITSSAQQSDGKIIVSGPFGTFSGQSAPGIARLNTDGTLDNTFNVGTGFTSASSFNAIYQQLDSKILFGGSFTQYYSGISANNLVRLNTDGSPDLSLVIGTGFNATVQVVIQQPDSKIIVGGNFTTYSGVTANRIIRLNSGGTIDNTFSGITTGFDSAVSIIRIESNGMILVGGQFNTFNNIIATRIVRLNPDGSYDNTFNGGTGGFNTNQMSWFSQESGTSVFVGGGFTTYGGSLTNRIARLNIDGTVDNTFSGNGTTNIATFGNQVTTINTTNDNKIIIEGDFSLNVSGLSYSRIAKLNIDGNVDTTFPPSMNYNSIVNNAIITSDNKLVSVGSFTSSTGGTTNRILRLLSGGTVDPSFNSLSGFNNTVYSTAIQSDGKIIAGGNFTQYYSGGVQNYIIRLNTDGTIDTSFSANPNNIVFSVLVQPDGKILVGGFFTFFNGAPANYIIRLNTNGTKDNTFNSVVAFNNFVSHMKLESDGKILLIGGFTSYSGVMANNLIRLNTDGSIDTSYSGTGASFSNGSPSFISQQSGTTFIGGAFNYYGGIFAPSLIRLNTDGTKDTSFEIGTGTRTLANHGINGVLLQSDGKIIFATTSTIFNGTPINYMGRLFPNGSVDVSFRGGSNNYVLALGRQTDGKILATGSFNSWNGVSTGSVVRLNQNTGNTLYYKILQYGSNIIIK